MNFSLTQLMSSRVVAGFSEQRLAYLAEKVQLVQAEYCAVLQATSKRCIGVIRLADVAGRRGSENRLLVDLIGTRPLIKISLETPADKVENIFEKSGRNAILVLDADESFVGIITRESYSAHTAIAVRRKYAVLENELRNQHTINRSSPDQKDSAFSDRIVPFERNEALEGEMPGQPSFESEA